ncbi:MAG TPA: hypothetical protein VIS74_02040, partial [Chthoniobacterales bacterium]
GSMAMNYYTTPRMTRDIDMVVELSASDAEKMASAFSPDYLAESAAIEDAIRHQGMFNLIHLESIIKVDCIIRKESPYREHEFARRQRANLGGFETWIVSKEDLIISKLDWAKESHSERQMDDIQNLLASGYDADYLGEWIKRLGLTSIWNMIPK